MIEITNKQKCCGCWACVNVCPKQCITMQTDSEGFNYPSLDETKCINCNLCEKVCPEKNCTDFDSKMVDVYFGYAKNDNVRLNSSSGGLFGLIAEVVIENNGVVFGASWDEEYRLRHTLIESKKDLCKIMGSKYVQSEIGNTYSQAKLLLEQKRMVLFSGTPCQIEGLLRYLTKTYTNLVTIDFICHGIPSPAIWSKYLQKRQNEFGSNVKSVSFRDKLSGWKNYSVRLSFENGREYIKSHNDDSYMKLFLNNYSLRPSCYSCSFKKISRNSDITLADFWGIDGLFMEFDDDKGVSLAFIHSDVGLKILNCISNDVFYKQKVDLNDSIKHNSSIVLSAGMPLKREKVIREIFKKSADVVAKKYCSESLYKRILRRITRLVKRLDK